MHLTCMNSINISYYSLPTQFLSWFASFMNSLTLLNLPAYSLNRNVLFSVYCLNFIKTSPVTPGCENSCSFPCLPTELHSQQSLVRHCSCHPWQYNDVAYVGCYLLNYTGTPLGWVKILFPLVFNCLARTVHMSTIHCLSNEWAPGTLHHH